MNDRDSQLEQLEPLLIEIIERWSPDTFSGIIRGGQERAGIIANILSNVPDGQRDISSQLFPKLLLRDPTIDATLTSVAWQTQSIIEGQIDPKALEEIYKTVRKRYRDNSSQAGYEEENVSIHNLMQGVTDAVSHAVTQGKVGSDISFYLRLFLARFARDFEHNLLKAEAIYRELIAEGKIVAASILGEILETSGRTLEAENLYRGAIEKYGDLASLEKLIHLLSVGGKTKEAYDLFALYTVTAKQLGRPTPPFILFTGEVMDDDSLEEVTSLAHQMIDYQVLEQDASSIFRKAQAYVNSEMRKQAEFRHATLLRYEKGKKASSMHSPLPLSEEYHHFWIRELSLHMMNACVLLDNTPLRTFEISGDEGDWVIPSGELTSAASSNSLIPKAGKAERFIKLLSFLSSSLDGRVILGEFFHRYPIDWIRRHNKVVKILYERKSDPEPTEEDSLDEDTIVEVNDREESIEVSGGEGMNLPEGTVFPHWMGIPVGQIAIIPEEPGVPNTPQNQIPETRDGNLEESDTGVENSSSEEGSFNPEKVYDDIDEILCYMNNMYGSGADGALHEALIALYDEISAESQGVAGKNRGLDESIRLFEQNVAGLPEAYREAYEGIEAKIREKYGETVRRGVLYFATYAFTINDSIPEFIQEDYILLWYLVMSHLLGTPAIDDKFLKLALDKSPFRQDNLEESAYLNSIIISTLNFTGNYGYAADFIADLPEKIDDPTRLVAFFRALSYLGDEERGPILEDLRASLKRKGFSPSIEKHISRVMSGIDSNEEYAEDDRACCILSQSYWRLIQGHRHVSRRLLEPIITNSISIIPETIAEARLLSLRGEIDDDILEKNPRHLSELGNIFPDLSYELQTECLIYILRLSIVCGIYDIFDLTIELAREKEAAIGLWATAQGLVQGDDENEIVAIHEFAQSDLYFLPEEVAPVLAEVAQKHRDKIEEGTPTSTPLEASYIIAHFSHIGAPTGIEAIREHFEWLNMYLKNFEYTDSRMNSISDIFQSAFGGIIDAQNDGDPITPAERLFYHTSRHFGHFIQIITQMWKSIEGQKGEDPEDEANIQRMKTQFQKNCAFIFRLNFEIFQRIPMPGVGDYIESFRKSSILLGTTPPTFTGNLGAVHEYSSLIH